ncbi:MAG TPA: magnesium transporter [Candidatus Binatia bacterium]|jgi:magnesium transporter
MTSEELTDDLHGPDGPTGAARAQLLTMRDWDLAELINTLPLAEAAAALRALPPERASALVDQPSLRRRAAILEQLEPALAARILDGASADERTQILRDLSPHECHRLLPSMKEEARQEAERLLKYPPRTAGGIMTTEFVRLAPTMTVRDALTHIRGVARDMESIYACYVLDEHGGLLGAVSLRDLVMAEPGTLVTEVMRRKPIATQVDEAQGQVAAKISKYNLLAVPVLERDGHVVGFVTVDDVIDVMVEEDTESALRMGAVEPGALDEPYMLTPLAHMVRKRASWLVVLFLSEMLTATAMSFFEGEIARAVVLALFVPLIISSGGNSGSQAATLVIRAMALGEVRVADWWRIVRREVLAGLALGLILGTIGFLRIALWTLFTDIYGPHWALVALTVGVSLVGVVLWGTLSGSTLPLILKRVGADPATSSAPFVATLVDVTGLVIYFSVAWVILRGSVL